jgi:hypothetical protein
MEKPTANAPDQVYAPPYYILPNNHSRKTNRRGFARTSSFVKRTAESRFARSKHNRRFAGVVSGVVELMTNQGLVVGVGAIR